MWTAYGPSIRESYLKEYAEKYKSTAQAPVPAAPSTVPVEGGAHRSFSHEEMQEALPIPTLEDFRARYICHGGGNAVEGTLAHSQATDD